VAWSGKGHRTPVNTVLGSIARFHYPGVVQFNGTEIGRITGLTEASNHMDPTVLTKTQCGHRFG
jgi:hypothetical protein